MFGIDDVVEGVAGTVGGVPGVVGVAAITAVAMVGAPYAKPLAKRAIKGYFRVTQRARELAAEANEQLQDLYAEAKYEYESQLNGETPTESKSGLVLPGAEAAPAPRRRSPASSTTTPAEQPA
jgi:hypothetical protein